MKSKQRLWVGACVGSLVLVGALFTKVASAGVTWVTLPANFFGFGGDFFESSRITLPSDKDEVKANRGIRLAAAGTYQVPDRSGVVKSITITNEGGLLESKFGIDATRIFYSKGNINDFSAALSNPSDYGKKYWAVFMAAQTAIACKNGTVYSDAVSGPGSFSSQRLGSYTAVVEVFLCSDGSLPLNGQAAYAHGIRGGG